MDEFKSNVTHLVISKIVDQLVNIAVTLSFLEWDNWAGKLVAARTKSLFLQFWLFSFKTKNRAPKETFCSSYRRLNWRTPFKDSINTQNATRTAVHLYLLSHTYNKLFCFNNCDLFFCAIFNKTLKDCSLGKYLFF